MSKKAITKKQTIEKPRKLNLLRNVPFDNGFHFFTEHSKYTGITAISIAEFAEKIQVVRIQSVTYHFQRQDFQKWLKNTIGDEKLAKRIDRFKALSSDENLRNELFKTVHNRIIELQ